ncbi:MAG: hypothetical protein KGD60_15580, partial [Candidatus Thorarchaeota archaeon]|nr:hypothetical protein [Candidatus Thorarchaeota archaeon]
MLYMERFVAHKPSNKCIARCRLIKLMLGTIIINRLKKYGLKFELSEDEKKMRSSKLEGLIFVISGTFENYSRDELKEIIEKNGGKNVSSISSKTNYL